METRQAKEESLSWKLRLRGQVKIRTRCAHLTQQQQGCCFSSWEHFVQKYGCKEKDKNEGDFEGLWADRLQWAASKKLGLSAERK